MDFVPKTNTTGFTWIGKQKRFFGGEADVSAHVGKSNKREIASFTFRNDCWKKFDAGYIMFGIDGDRLWFAGADNTTGYKLSTAASGCINRYAQCNDPALVEWVHNHLGDYELHRDTKSQMCFIDGRRIK